MWSEESHTTLWNAGEIVPAGTYVRVDDQSYRPTTLTREDALPATFDGHVAQYRLLAHPKVSTQQARETVITGN